MVETGKGASNFPPCFKDCVIFDFLFLCRKQCNVLLVISDLENDCT